jgi:hypothetical protein
VLRLNLRARIWGIVWVAMVFVLAEELHLLFHVHFVAGSEGYSLRRVIVIAIAIVIVVDVARAFH